MPITLSGDGITSDNITSLAASKLTGQVPIVNAPSGNVIQVVSATFSGSSDHTSTSFVDTNVVLSITTTIANSKILFLGSLGLNASTSVYMRCRLTRNGTEVWLAGRSSSGGNNATGDIEHWASLNYLDSPNASSGTSLTYRIQLRSETGNLVRINDNAESSIIIMELRP